MKQKWEVKKLGSVVQTSENSIDVKTDVVYNLLGMSLEGRGLFLREQKTGINIGSKKLNEVIPGQFIYSRLFAWKGAFDYVGAEFAGCYVSDEYPTFDVDPEQADPIFINYYFNQSKVWKEVEDYCIGVTKASRNRFKEKFFLNLTIPLPPLEEQQRIVAKIESIRQRIEEIRQLRREQEHAWATLLFSRYTEAIAGAAWLPLREVAPIIRREVSILQDELYPEVGIRSFGRGTFHKPALTGIEVGTKKLYQIKAGDLLFSNVFAWEGAITVAKEEDNDRYGSHRFISCLVKENVLAEFLGYHFLTSKGMEDITSASPGGAGRNKTLGLEKLMRIKVPLPPLPIQQEFVSLIHKVNTIRAQYAEQEKELAQLLPSLLDKAFKGEL